MPSPRSAREQMGNDMDGVSRPIWRTAFLRLQSQFSDAAMHYPVMGAWLCHRGDDDPSFSPDSPHHSHVCRSYHGTFNRHTPLVFGSNGHLLFDDEITDDWTRSVLCLAHVQRDQSRNQAFRQVDIIQSGGRTPEAKLAAQKFHSLAESTGRAIESLPFSALKGLHYTSLSESDLTRRWIWCVFDIAWSKKHPTLAAERQLNWLNDGCHSCKYDPATVKSISERFGPGIAPEKWTEALPDCFVSRIDDIFSASAAAIELLLADADSDFGETNSEPLRTSAGNEAIARPRGTDLDLTRHSVDPEFDPIEDALSGQLLAIYLFLRPGKSWTSYNTLAERDEFWTGGKAASDARIYRALKRLQAELNQIGHATALKIENASRRTKLTN
jgi:hypothetical protein